MIKHKKLKNSLIIFELLSQHLLQEVADKNIQKAKKIILLIKEYFSKNTEINKEIKLFNTVLYSQLNKWQTASKLLEECLQQSITLDKKKLLNEKYSLLNKIYKLYDKDVFFNKKIDNYKLYASIYQLFEDRRNIEKLNISDKIKLEEYVINNILDNKELQRTNKFMKLLIENEKRDKEVTDLVYQIALKKFNNKYSKELLNEQKNILQKYINSKNRNFITEEKRRLENKIYYTLKNIKNKELAEKLFAASQKLDNIHNLKEDKQIELLMTFYNVLEEIKKYKINGRQ